MSIFSMINDEGMSIQGRPVPFDNEDVVPIGVRISTAGSHTIALGAIDGFFGNTNKKIYIEDTMIGVIHDLKSSPYIFTSDAGKFTTRFKLRYKKEIENDKINNFKPIEKVLVYSKENTVTAYSFINKITNIRVYDLLGREVYEDLELNNQEIMINLLNMKNQPLIVKIALDNNEIVTKKIVL